MLLSREPASRRCSRRATFRFPRSLILSTKLSGFSREDTCTGRSQTIRRWWRRLLNEAPPISGRSLVLLDLRGGRDITFAAAWGPLGFPKMRSARRSGRYGRGNRGSAGAATGKRGYAGGRGAARVVLQVSGLKFQPFFPRHKSHVTFLLGSRGRSPSKQSGVSREGSTAGRFFNGIVLVAVAGQPA